MNFFSFIPIRVHCWGGLGSQLYALSTAYDLKIKYPKRRINLVLHTGGVTKRVSELDFIPTSDFKLIQINDFQARSNDYVNQGESTKIKRKRSLVKILYRFNFIVSANSNIEFRNIQPWTFSTRGHYYHREVSTNFYEYLLKYLKLKERPITQSEFEIAIHYRMGDLLTLSEKSISPAHKLINVVRQVQKTHNNSKIYVYSDSPQVAKETLFNAGLTDEFTVNDFSTKDVIRACVGANYFIGTGSKVSLWIVNIRRYLGEINDNYLEGFDDKLYEPN